MKLMFKQVGEFEYLDEITTLIQKEPNLSFRSREEIKELINRKEVFIAINEHELMGFLFVTPMGENYYELHAGYVKAKYRRNKIFNKLVDYVEKNFNGILYLATFHEYTVSLFEKRGYKIFLIRDLPFKVKKNFYLLRLKTKRILSILNFFKKSKPIYLKFNNL